jgi:hypothetical protein
MLSPYLCPDCFFRKQDVQSLKMKQFDKINSFKRLRQMHNLTIKLNKLGSEDLTSCVGSVEVLPLHVGQRPVRPQDGQPASATRSIITILQTGCVQLR